jgi:hypothetical protein
MNKRQTEIYNDTAIIVKERGGILLESSYLNSKAPLLIECSEGHQWESNREMLKAGNWCPRCAGRGRSRQEIAAAAQAKGGDLVSKSFSKMSDRYLWRCEFGHEWEAVANNVINNGRWCPECGRKESDEGRRRYSLEDLRAWAKEKGGECLATEFTSVVASVRWRCSCGFEWAAEPRKIRDGGWCPECAKKIRGAKRRVHKPETLDEFARSKGGRCYPPDHFDVKTPIKWECEFGHSWIANADNIINGGKWCPECAGNRPLTIDDMRNLALKRYGGCLSEKYVNSSTELWWVCSEGHTWSAVPSSVRAGSWCPTCSAGLGERICREHFEQILGSDFPKARPSWLLTSDGNQLELDGFSSQLALAFEHQGSQHYEDVPHFHREKDSFKAQQTRDREKKELCRDNGIDLIEVPSVLEILGVSGLPAFIADELAKLGRELPKDFLQIEVDYSEAYKPDEIENLKEVARKHGGQLISTTYKGIFEKLTWRCSEGHEFRAAPNNVKNSGSWCPKCYGLGQTISDMREIARERGGECLSTKYVNNITPLVWRCAEGHTWKARPSNVKFGTWCPECGRKESGLKRRKYDLKSLQDAAKKLGGTCESNEYLGYKIRHRWKCSCGAEFEQTAERILRNGSWCTDCRHI